MYFFSGSTTGQYLRAMTAKYELKKNPERLFINYSQSMCFKGSFFLKVLLRYLIK